MAGLRFGGPPIPTNTASGPAGALQDILLSQRTTSTWTDLGLLTVMPTAPEPTDIGPITASTSTLTAVEGDKEGDAVFPAKVEPDLTAREKTTRTPSETTPHPTTHRVSTTRATTAQAPVTSHLHRDMQPDHPKTSAPEGAGQADPHIPSLEDRGPSATERAAEEETVTHFSAGEGSGEQVRVCSP